MKNIKYIIIFTLILAIAMIYKQLDDYKDISSSLLSTNTNSSNKIAQFKDETFNLKQENKELKDKILQLEDEIIKEKNKAIQLSSLENDLLSSEINNTSLKIPSYTENYNEDNISKYDLSSDVTPYKKDTKEKTNSSSLTPNVEINREEEEVTGVGVQYTQKF